MYGYSSAVRAPLLPLLMLGACVASEPEPAPDPGRGARPIPAATRTDAPERLIGMGDVHGDFDAMMAALRMAEVVDDDGVWNGGETIVVQTGDQLDRGEHEQEILDYLDVLADQAWAAGGQLIVLNGNHETMNVELDLRYVTTGGFADFAEFAPPADEQDSELLEYAEAERGRVAAFRPGGVYARLLAGQNLAVVVGDTVFVHGGVLSEHADVGLESINADVSQWMLGDADEPDWIDGDGPVWVRDYSDETGPDECDDLEESLATLGASRMVVGHTVYGFINSECDEQVWRVDVGMAAHYGGDTAVLEIRGDELTILD